MSERLQTPISDETLKATMFQQGLRDEIRKHIVALRLKTYNEIVDAAFSLEQDYLNSRRGRFRQGGSSSNARNKKGE